MAKTKCLRALFLMVGLCLLDVMPASADTDNDFQQWSLIFVNHHLNDKWSASIQLENRLRYLLHVTHPLGDMPRRQCASTPPAPTPVRWMTLSKAACILAWAAR